jgi:6,7-dimethyl-8-ribityllumazine synthase
MRRVNESAGKLSGAGKRFAIVVSRFNEFLTEHMLDACIDTLVRHGTRPKAIHVVRVPGALEIPVALKHVLRRRRPHAAVCLGCVIRGETVHFDHVAAETARGIAEVSRESGIPVASGVVAAENLAQAIERAGAKMGNKGRNAAMAALEMANLLDLI